MLWLKRNTRWNELFRCSVSGDNIYPGEYYYQDDVDNTIIKATVYKDLKDKRKEQEWDYSKLNNAKSEAEYRNMLREATKAMLGASILDRKVAGKYDPNPETENEIVEDLYNTYKGGNPYND